MFQGSNYELLLTGCLIGAAGCCSGSIGDVLVRSSHAQVRRPPQVRELPKSIRRAPRAAQRLLPSFLRVLQYPLTRPRSSIFHLWPPKDCWVLGMALVAVIQPLLLGLALMLAPAILVIAMSALSLATSILAAVVCLGEVLTVGAIAACLLIGVGLLGVVSSFHGQSPRMGPLEAFAIAHTSVSGMVYIFLVSLITIVCASISAWPGRLKILGRQMTVDHAKAAAALLAGLLSGLAEAAAKLIIDILSGESRVLEDDRFWISVALTAALALGAAWAFNLSFKMAEAVLVVPLRNAANILFGSLAGLLLLGERTSAVQLMGWSFVLIGTGVGLILFCQLRHEEAIAEEDEESDMIEIALKPTGETTSRPPTQLDDESTTGTFAYRSEEPFTPP